MTGVPSAGTCLLWSARLVSVGLVISCLEYIAERGVLSNAGLIDWELGRTRTRLGVTGPGARIFNALFSYPNVLALVACRLVLAVIMLVAGPAGWIVTVPAFALAVAFCIRSPYSKDGADHMSNIVLGALAVAALVPQPGVRLAAVAFIALQCALSYTIAGIAKLPERQWRTGDHLCGILGTECYGLRPFAQRLNRKPALARALSVGILFWESTFILGMLAPRPVALAYLGLGIAFHLTIAVFMGLNSFVWPFLSAYPCLFYWLEVRPW